MEQMQIQLLPYEKPSVSAEYDLERIIFDLDSQMEMLSSQADKTDYLLSIASGLLCGALDILWVGDFSLERGRAAASDNVDGFVKGVANILGCEGDDLQTAVRFLEEKFPIPSDGNNPDFGGGLQHHLRDFAHHPTIVGLAFSLLTQFTCKSYGTDVNGRFLIVDVPEASRAFIGDDEATKVLYGTATWFFHLVSDMAGSSSTAGRTGGTGIPGPLLALAKELSVLPFFRDLKIGDNSLSVFLSKLFNGTLLAKRDGEGGIKKETVLRFDLRGEIGLGLEIGRQAIPVLANECFVRTFYFIRRLASEIRKGDIRSFAEMSRIDWANVRPTGNPTIDRMLAVATGVFTTIDVGEAILSQGYWVSVNYVGVGRFSIAIGKDVAWSLKKRNVRQIKQMYEEIKRFSYTKENERIYQRIGRDMDMEKLGLTVEQTELLYNLEYHKTLNDIEHTKLPLHGSEVKKLKREWLEEWKQYISIGFSSFVQMEGVQLHWYNEEDLIRRVEASEPCGTWFRLVLLETMLFEPYYPLTLEKDKKGNDVPSKKYKEIQSGIGGYRKSTGDDYLDGLFHGDYYAKGYIKRLRRCYDKVLRELNEILKTVITTITITAVIAFAAVVTAGAFAPAIAVALVGSNFAGLSGAALTSACLAYLGGGAVAIGGAGMAGGTIAIVGGGAALGIGVGAGVGGAVGAVGLAGKRNTILQSAKLLVSVREIFLNDEHDLAYSTSIHEKYVQNILEIEKGLSELRLRADVAHGKEKKLLKEQIKRANESVEAMRIANKSMAKFMSSFETGMAQLDEEV